MQKVSLFGTIVAAALCAGGLAAMHGCTLVTANEKGKALGEPCADDGECQGAQCIDKICGRKCSQSADCPSPTACYGAVCQLPLKVRFIYVGVPQDEGWTLTHEEGRQFAISKLPYLDSDIVANTFLPDAAGAAADKFIAEGAQVVIANSFSLRTTMVEKAKQYPDVKFLTCSGNDISANHGSYFARSYQSWYLAGFAAARKSKTGRLGFVGSFVTPEVVRHINAFTRGAQKVNPAVKVEVRWEGFWFDIDPPVKSASGQDEFNETRLTKKMIETGCDVITHNSDHGRTVDAVEQAHKDGKDVYSIGNDNRDACSKRGPTSCLGVPYWNWGPMYVRMFDEMHRGTWKADRINDGINQDENLSTTVFGLNEAVTDNSLKLELGALRADLATADGSSLPFKGPYCVSQDDQRTPSCLEAGEGVPDSELVTMCWFVQGVVMKQDLTDPLSADVPARVPDGSFAINPESPNEKPDCRANQ